MSIIKNVTLQKIVAHDFRYDPRTNCDVQLQNVAHDDGLKSPKHVEHLMMNKETL